MHGKRPLGLTHTMLHRVCKAEPQKQDGLPQAHKAQRNIEDRFGGNAFFISLLSIAFSPFFPLDKTSKIFYTYAPLIRSLP